MTKRRLWVDGSDGPDPDTAIYQGYERGAADYPPFAVYDEDRQENLIETRWLIVARLVKWWHGGGWSLP
jgi:hypothetical protein